ncbi:NAD(P)/FAD-dependent oxidoreductase [Streptomyces sp. NPDC090119]|uniref:NAD(P)/FAD-dependent oxidoreductase n=1 Tax=Streptomyces sp. NPDC090119 TaxID=3365951 RepID=UPI0037F861F4
MTYSAFTGWADTPADVLPALEGDTECDVAVVGGGLGGMATALRLVERGVDVVLIEAGVCGAGASSRNAGQLTNAPAGDPQILSTMHPRRFRDVVRFAEGAVPFVEGLLDRFDIDCGYERTGNLMAAVSKGQLRKAKRNTQILQKAGADAEFVEGGDFGVPEGILGGSFERGGGTLNPGLLAFGVRKALRGAGVRVFERTPVRAVESHGGSVHLSTPRGRVRAGRVVLATNAHSRDLAFAPKRLAAPVWVSMAETEPIAPERLEATGWTSRAGLVTLHNLMQSFRITPRGTIAFGVRRLQLAHSALGSRQPDPSVVADLTRGFHDRFPSLRDVAVERAWGGWIAMTPSWLPVVGESTKNVFYSIACNGHGLAQAPYLGALLADRLAGDELHDDLAPLWRDRPRFAPSPFLNSATLTAGWMADRLADRLNRGRS